MFQIVNKALCYSKELSETLQSIVDGLTEIFGYYSSGVYLLSEDGSHLISKIYSIDSKASKTLEKLIGSSIKDYKIPLYPGSMLSEILRTKKPLLVEDIKKAIKSHTDRKELKPLAKPIAKITGIKSGIGAPLIAGGKTVGLIGIASRQQLTSLDIERLKAVADQAAVAIERTSLYEALRESEEKYRDLYDRAPDMYCSLDKNGIIVDCNKTGARMLGYEKEEIIGMPLTDFSTDESRRLFEKDFPWPNKKRHKLNLEREFVRKDGTVFPASLNIFAELDENGELIRTKTIARDITERKEAEEELKGYSMELERSNRLKDVFIDIMRHDLLNSAGFVRNSTEMALELREGPEKRELLQMAISSNERIIDMIENASLIARLEYGEKLKVKGDDLGTVLRKAVNDVANFADEKKTEIKITAEGEFPAKVSPLVYTAFSNLLDNALKYGPENSEVVVGIEEDGANWKISVADRGEGIPDENKETIFERFKRVKKGAVKGTGLGLAIVKRIVETHNGKVWVEDNPGGGNVFHIRLPKEKEGR